jgi:hypothetical protein
VYIAKIENIVGKIHYFFEEVIFLWKKQAFSTQYEKSENQIIIFSFFRGIESLFLTTFVNQKTAEFIFH